MNATASPTTILMNTTASPTSIVNATSAPSTSFNASTKSPTALPTASPTASPTSSSKPTFEGCRPKYDDIYYYCPFDRYCEWAYYSAEKQTEFTDKIGYVEDTWNSPWDADLELKSFGLLTEDQRDGLIDLGFNEDQHDCCQNHFYDYYWSEFDPADGYGTVLEAWQTLGYNEQMWNDGTVAPESELYWDDLPLEMQYAAMELCYSKETWNEVPSLPKWALDVDLPGAFPYTPAPTTAPMLSPSLSSAPTNAKPNAKNEATNGEQSSSAFSVISTRKVSVGTTLVVLAVYALSF